MANNFLTDPSCIALWRFESGALTTDSIGSNTLSTSASAPTTDISDYIEGAACTILTASNNQYYYINDSNLDSGFPLKNGDSLKQITICFKFKPLSPEGHIFGKWYSAGNKRSLQLAYQMIHPSYGKLVIWFGYSGGSLSTYADPTIYIYNDKWYDIGLAVDGINKTWNIRVTDRDTGISYNNNGTFLYELNVEDAPFFIGAIQDFDSYVNGKYDEMVIFNRILSNDEIDAIRDGIYANIPIVATNAVTNIESDSALANGEVISGSDITERGFVWSTLVNPTTSDNKVTVAGTIGILSGTIFGLSDDTIYHVRCFATNGAGTAYGEDRSFQTLSVQYTEFEEMEERTFSKPIFIVTMGSFEVPQYDIIDLDQLTLSRSDDFSVVTSDITITLNNNTGKYTPSRSNFIWAGESWYHQYFKLEFTYQDINEKYLLFEGYITKWNQKNTKDPAYDSQVDGQFVEVTAEDHCSMLNDRIIGQPDDDGTINPFVHGRIFKQSETLNAKTFWTADDDIDFETGDFTQVDSTVGTATIETVDPYAGTYCAKFVSNTGSDCAYCVQDVFPTGGYEFHISAYFKMETIPDPAYQNNIRFLAIHDQVNNELIAVTMDRKDTNQYILALSIWGFDFQQTSIDLSDYQNIWVKMDLLVRNDVTNNMMLTRLFFNDDDVASITSQAEIASQFRYAIFGAKLMYTFTTPWVLYVDDVKIYTIAYPLGYYLPGGVYQSINAVYVDGSFWPKKNKSVWVPYWNDNSWKFNYLAYYGKGSTPENYRTNLTYCLVDFTDYNNQPSGSVLIDATKDAIEHPVDQIESILEEVDLDTRIDSTNFTIAKSINPDDTIGIYIDNQSAADAITSICQNTMNSFVERQGEFGILPFTGQHMIDYERSLVESKYHSIEQATDMDNLQTQIDVVWGWYDKNKKLFYRVQNDEMILIIGNQSTKLDLSYGQDVSTNNTEMAKAKARLLLNRYSGPIDEVIIKGNLSFIRIEIGYGVLIHSDFYETDLIYEVIEKIIDFNDKTVELRCHRYMGNGIGQVFMGSSTIAPTVLIVGDSTFTGDIASSGEETSIGAIRTDVDYAYLPYYSKARGSTVDPTFIYGDINYTPTQAESIGASIDPTVAIS